MLLEIEAYNIPTNSYISAIQYLSDRPDRLDREYKEMIKDITGEEVSFDDARMYKYTLLYTVQEAIKQFGDTTDYVNPADVLKLATEKAEQFVNTRTYVFAKKDIDENAPQKLDASGNIKPKKGAKKIMAKEVWEKNKHQTMTRKEWIELLVAEVGLTKAGASTYYANLKAGRL
jgi:hypothetical protein